jgi:hypothetical protein
MAKNVLVVEIEDFKDFKRLVEAQQGLVFVTVGIQTDCLFVLPNKNYPCVYECIVPHGSWGELERLIHVIPGRIEGESA